MYHGEIFIVGKRQLQLQTMPLGQNIKSYGITMPANEEKEHVQSLEKKSPVPGKSRFYFACH